MACLGYFCKYKQDLTMPRTHGQPDRLGVRWKGQVTTGEVDFRRALTESDQAARLTIRHLAHDRRQGGRTEPLDSVLQSHTATK